MRKTYRPGYDQLSCLTPAAQSFLDFMYFGHHSSDPEGHPSPITPDFIALCYIEWATPPGPQYLQVHYSYFAQDLFPASSRTAHSLSTAMLNTCTWWWRDHNNPELHHSYWVVSFFLDHWCQIFIGGDHVYIQSLQGHQGSIRAVLYTLVMCLIAKFEQHSQDIPDYSLVYPHSRLPSLNEWRFMLWTVPHNPNYLISTLITVFNLCNTVRDAIPCTLLVSTFQASPDIYVMSTTYTLPRHQVAFVYTGR